MNEHITGAQARELLAGTTPGPWEWRYRADERLGGRAYEALGNEGQDALATQDSEDYASSMIGPDRNKALAAAAPDLASTVAWLYGKSPIPDDVEGDYYESFRGGYTYADGGQVEMNVDTDVQLSPDDAVDLARALLAAAEAAK